MDHDTLELVRLLCCRAGMLMEDASAMAVISPRDEDALREAVLGLGASTERMRALQEAATALLD